MIPTPADVLPVIERVVPDLAAALALGSDYADEQQPDPYDRDRWYWSHTARWRARNNLVAVSDKDGWTVDPSAPNSAIHLCAASVHPIRVLKTMNDTTPHAGRNKARQLAWSQSPLLVASAASGQPFSLVADWHKGKDGPVVHIGLPKAPGNYVGGADLYWRVEVTGDAGYDLGNLEFDPGNPPDDLIVTLKVDPSEFQVNS